VELYNVSRSLGRGGFHLHRVVDFPQRPARQAQYQGESFASGIGFRDGDGALYMANPSMNIQELDDKLYIVMSVTSVSRRKMRWTGWGGKYRNQVNGKNGFLVSPLHLAHTLDEQEHLDEWTLLDPQFVDENVKRLNIWDVAGRNWYVSRRNMRTLQADIKKFAEVPALV
jgi:hypothetical protein